MFNVKKTVEGAFDQIFKTFARDIGVIFEHPDAKAGSELMGILEEACENEIIKASPMVLEVAEYLKDLYAESSMFADLNDVLAPLESRTISKDKSRIAKSKNAEAREWVLAAWESRTDKEESKASFSIQHASLVNKQFKLKIRPDTIARDWLPKKR